MVMKNAPSILIADDDIGVLRLAQKALERERLVVSTATSGLDAVKWLGENQADLLLLDLKLPDLSAEKVIEHIGQMDCRPRFMIITGQGDERVAVEMMKKGALDYLVKDQDFLDFLPMRVQRVLQQIGMEKKMRRLEEEVLQISENEQHRIGQDLHDGICQQLVGIELISRTLEKQIARRSKKLATRMAEISGHIRRIAGETRALAHGLSPLALGPDGLMDTLKVLTENTEKLFLINCRFESEAPVMVNDHSAALHLYRITQEAVTNAIKHGQAKNIVVRLGPQKEAVTLSIEDDGRGLPAIKAHEQGGMGLHIMEYRARLIGATLTIQPRLPTGTTVICYFPPKAALN